MSAHGNQVRTGTFLPHFQNFDPKQPYGRLDSFCKKFKVQPETIRSVVVEPALNSGEVVTFRGEPPLFAYACGKNPDAITRMAETVIIRTGIPAGAEANQARNELWQILRDFSMGYGIPVEEQLGLVTKRALREKFNFSAVHTLTTMRFLKNLTEELDSHPSSFGKIRSAFIDVWAQEMEAEHFLTVFTMFIQGQISMPQADGSMLSINPTHCRTLVSPPLSPDLPYIVSTAGLSGSLSMAGILPPAEPLGISLDVMLLRKADTLIIADVTGSFA